MTTLTETIHAAAYIVSEARGRRSREEITVANTTAKVPGTVLGIVTATGVYDTYNPANTDGTETVAGILYAPVEAVSGGTGVQNVANVRDCEVRGTDLTWFSGATAAQITTGIAGLKALDIIVR